MCVCVCVCVCDFGNRILTNEMLIFLQPKIQTRTQHCVGPFFVVARSPVSGHARMHACTHTHTCAHIQSHTHTHLISI